MSEMHRRAERALEKLITDDGAGLYTSNGLLFNHTVFGRDVSMMSRWMLELGHRYRPVAHDVILTLARLQGIRVNRRSEEEPGRILNQYKSYAKWRATWALKNGGRIAGLLWGGSLSHELTFIGIDTTPLYILLVCEYAESTPGIFEEVVTRRDGTQVTIRESVMEALHWMNLHRQSHGFLARRRRNVLSLFFESWRDSHLAYLYPSGRLASLSRPVAHLEVQVLYVDALRAAAKALPNEHLTAAWKQHGDELAALTVERFWMADYGYFTMALDPDRKGLLHPIPTPASSPGWMLDSTIFDGIPADEQRKYVEAIVRRLGSSDFITKAGIRARGNGSDSGLGVADYHGSWTVWPMDTYKYARGLRRHGLPGLAHEMEQRVLRAVNEGGSFYEYFLVSPAGEVLWRPHAKPAKKSTRHINIQIIPERDLGWTIVACLLIGRQHIKAVSTAAWRGELEDEVLTHLRHQTEHPQTEYPFDVRRVRGAFKVAIKASVAVFQEYVLKR